MLEGVERLVDLVGLRAAGLRGASVGDVSSWTTAGDVGSLAATDGHFAAVGRHGNTVRLARTLGIPLRYFVAKLFHGPFLVVSDRMDSIFEWCRQQHIAWQFEPAYTRMVPAHYLVEIDQVGCPDPMPRYRRFFDPPAACGPSNLEEAGTAYATAALEAIKTWLSAVPAREPVAVAFSGGIDSTAVWLLARHAAETLGRNPSQIRAFTLDLGGGEDALQGERTAADLGLLSSWEHVAVSPEAYDLDEAIRLIEDYQPLDVECAAAATCLLGGIRTRYRELRYLLDGDGGDENLKSYPLEDSDLTLASLLKNPLLYQEGWGIDAIKHSLAYSGGLSRSYVRTFAPAARLGFEAFSPFSVRSVVGSAVAIPFERIVAGQEQRLYTLKAEVVRAGVRAVTGIDMPANPKRRFQDGVSASRRPRVSKAWCRRVFSRQWQERLRAAETATKRSGNEVAVTSR